MTEYDQPVFVWEVNPGFQEPALFFLSFAFEKVKLKSLKSYLFVSAGEVFENMRFSISLLGRASFLGSKIILLTFSPLE